MNPAINNSQLTTHNPHLPNHLLNIQNLKVSFHIEEGILHAVDGISFSMKQGTTLGLVGESGCGKSVTALSVMRLIPDPPGKIESGGILWKDKNLLTIPLAEMQELRGREIAMIFQEPMTSLNPVFTVGRQMEEALHAKFPMKKDKAKKKIMDMLTFVGISDPDSRIQNYPHELSGGMIQRIMIAMALLSQPDLLIADEPTTALDVTIQAQILQLMKELQQKTSMSILLITHNMGVIAETCDEVVVMYAGRIMEKSNVHALFDNPLHPYTFGLLKSIPPKGVTREKPLFTIEGTVPSLFHPPKGCRFAERCFQKKSLDKEKQDACFNLDPDLRLLEGDRLVACHFPLEKDRMK
ncbi:ABC transporter ATP-binding protein [Candidatus Sumerlaeota bacterium]|nr:ABC transporter ATP-binding protein [Candidatus Sumerlaeota bacterium]